MLKQIKRRSLAGWRQQIEAVDHNKFASFIADWQFITKPRRGLDALYDTIEQLQGAPLPASVLETEILPARITGYRVDRLMSCSSQENCCGGGSNPLAAAMGGLPSTSPKIIPCWPEPNPIDSELAQRIHEFIGTRGAPFFDDIVELSGAFRTTCLRRCGSWCGAAMRGTTASRRCARLGVRQKTQNPTGATANETAKSSRLPGSEGRWTLFDRVGWEQPSATEARTAQSSNCSNAMVSW